MARPRKPAQEHELSGTNRFHPERESWNRRNDRPLTSRPAPDRYLMRTKMAWTAFMDMKSTQKCLSVEDEQNIVVMFNALDRIFRTTDEIDKIMRRSDYSEWLDDRGNRDKLSNLYKCLKADDETYRQWAIRFGMTPTERSKLPAIKEEKQSFMLEIAKRVAEA